MDRETFSPAPGRILVRPAAAAEKVGSMYVPETARETPIRGTVVSVPMASGVLIPPDAKRAPCNQGDDVIFGKYCGTELTLNGEAHLVLEFADILGVIHVTHVEDASENSKTPELVSSAA